jgi:hypothetical protein
LTLFFKKDGSLDCNIFWKVNIWILSLKNNNVIFIC